MRKAHPILCTLIMKVPKVVRYILDHLKQDLLKSRGSELGTIQYALILATGLLNLLMGRAIGQ